jgi:hypothetical protein
MVDSLPVFFMKSRGIQFWTLMVVSSIVFLLYMGEIYASHSIIKEQRFLVDQREIADSSPYYKDAWQKLAVAVWKGSQQDPALGELLKSEGIGVHEGPPPGSAPATNGAPAAPAVPATGTPPPATP